jgi:hypothetical protein
VAYRGFVNLTPFAAEPVLLADEHGRDVFTCVVKGTFDIRAHREESSIAIAAEQAPVLAKPAYYDEPETSSIKYDADTAFTKVGTDVALVGHARATMARAQWLDVTLSVGPARSIVRVFGNRVWTVALGRWVQSAPEPFEAIPLVYERAFGGWDRSSVDEADHQFEPRNPVGVGFLSRRHGIRREGDPLPNLENPYEPITGPADRPVPAGFGFIGTHWQPRAGYAGTYDDAWKDRRMPLLPADFDRRFYNSAHPSLALGGFLQGGEPVEITNAWVHGMMRFMLPAATPMTTVRLADGTTQRAGMELDTVVINTDEDKLFMIWRASVPVPRGIHSVRWAKAHLADGSRAS